MKTDHARLAVAVDSVRSLNDGIHYSWDLIWCVACVNVVKHTAFRISTICLGAISCLCFQSSFLSASLDNRFFL